MSFNHGEVLFLKLFVIKLMIGLQSGADGVSWSFKLPVMIKIIMDRDPNNYYVGIFGEDKTSKKNTPP